MRRAGISWRSQTRRRRVIVALGVVLAIAISSVANQADGAVWSTKKVIVRVAPGTTASPFELLLPVAGVLDRTLPSINGFSAWVPVDNIGKLEAEAGVIEVSDDAALSPPIAEASPSGVKGRAVEGFVESEFGRSGGGASFSRLSVDAVAAVTGADELHKAGITGAGIDIALIDTGVSPVPGIGPVLNGPDLSFDAQISGGLPYVDAYGHGTHLAGIINGSGNGVNGIAPGARIVNVKTGSTNGAVDVVQVLAAIDWVVQHAHDPGLNIRVIALAYGTDSLQPYTIDPLAYGAEVAWRKGIVVVAAAGNTGQTAVSLNDPAIDPYVIAVGASDAHGTYSTGDDTVAPFSATGNDSRRVDVVAPGRSVVSLRVPNSYVDVTHPEGREPDGLLRGSGTSQATAVVAGSVALMLQDRPSLTPDQVKWALRKTAKSLPGSDGAAQGAGEIDVRRASQRNVSNATAQAWPTSTGTGSLEAARGSLHVSLGGVTLEGEIDIFGNPWNGVSWSGVSWSGVSWSGGQWLGVSWSGVSWSGVSWSGVSWSGVSWSGVSWSGVSWSGVSWSGVSWSGVW